MIQEIEFARDSPLEGAGFEPSVPGIAKRALRPDFEKSRWHETRRCRKMDSNSPFRVIRSRF
jgi:hypothetical protein